VATSTRIPALLLAWLLVVGCGSGASGDGAGPSPVPPTPPTFADGFETGLGAWTRDADVPPSPEDPDVPVAWSIEPSSEVVHTGAASARFDLDGRQDDGTIWLERTFDVGPGTPWRVTVEGTWWSPSESFNTTAVVVLYAGPDSPEEELDFAVAGPLDLVAGWRAYRASFDVTAAGDGRVHVGVGLSVVWETWITYYLDDVRVWLEPR